MTSFSDEVLAKASKTVIDSYPNLDVVVYKTFRADLARELGVEPEVLKGPELKVKTREIIGVAIANAHTERKKQKQDDASDGEVQSDSDASDGQSDDESSVPKGKRASKSKVKKKKTQSKAASSDSSTELGTQLTALRKMVKVSCAGPRLYRELPEDKHEQIDELSQRLKRAGVPFQGLVPTAQEISRAQRRQTLKQEMEGIDMSNIISGPTRRRRRVSAEAEQQQPMDQSEDGGSRGDHSATESEDEEDDEDDEDFDIADAESGEDEDEDRDSKKKKKKKGRKEVKREAKKKVKKKKKNDELERQSKSRRTETKTTASMVVADAESSGEEEEVMF